MRSAIVKRSVVIGDEKSSVSLEDAFWVVLKELAREQKVPLCELITGVNARRSVGNLSSALRLFVLDQVRERASRAQSARAADAQPGARPGATSP